MGKPIDIYFVELHSPLFFAGKNHGVKLAMNKNSPLKLSYDREEKELLIEWQGQRAIVPTTNIVSMTVTETPDRNVFQQAHPMVAGAVASAQVETPMSHVHAGFGHGKTGASKVK